jgi:AAA ATPase domain
VLIVGEPGLGKSRLIEEFHTRLRDVPHTWVEWTALSFCKTPHCTRSPSGVGSASASLAQVKLDSAENAALLAPLLDMPVPAERALALPPEELRRRQLAALTNWVMAGAKVQPVVLVLEDLHWADPTTIDVLRGIAERGSLSPLFALITARPEFRPPWGMRSHHGTISLAPLDRQQVRHMVKELASRQGIAPRAFQAGNATVGQARGRVCGPSHLAPPPRCRSAPTIRLRWMAVVMARKKRSAKSGIRVRRGDVTPPDAIRRDEIVEEIVDHLRPWKDRKDTTAVIAEVSRELDVLVKLAPLEAKLSDRTQNRTHAQQLDRALAEVETLLASAPGVLASVLFNPLPPLTMTEDGELTMAMPPLIEDIERAYWKRADSFAAELNRLRKVCARAIDPGFGSHPNYDHAKHACAWFAQGLMQGLSDRKITGTKDDAFRAIASLLYEAISRQQDADLKRACDSVLRDIRNRELGSD